MRKIALFLCVLLIAVMLLSSCSEESKGIGETGISLAEYDKLSLGMSYNDVCNIVGGKGKAISKREYEEANRTVYITTYRFEGETGGYAEIEITVYGYKDMWKIDLGDYLTGMKQFDLK